VHGGSASGTQLGANYTLEGPRGWVLSNLALAGDVNADGVIDLVATATAAAPGATPSRAAVIYLVRTAADRAQAPVVLTPPAARVAGFGVACAGVGDVNGDGVDDVAVGTGTNDATAMNYVCVFPGTMTGIGTSPMQCISGVPLGRMGASVGGAGDVNGDGFEDVLVGARGIVDMTRGTVQLFRGRIVGLSDTAAVTLTGADISGQFGASLSAWR
jgi:hypothetical protein